MVLKKEQSLHPYLCLNLTNMASNDFLPVTSKMTKIYDIMLLYFTYHLHQATGEENAILKSKNPLPYFRRHIEGTIDNTTIQTTLADDSRSNLVSFLIKNVKQIYNELTEPEQTEISVTRTPTLESTTCLSVNTSSTVISTEETEFTYLLNFENIINTDIPPEVDDKVVSKLTRAIKPNMNYFMNSNFTYKTPNKISYENRTVVPNTWDVNMEEDLYPKRYGSKEKEELMHLSKNLMFFEPDRLERANNMMESAPFAANKSDPADGRRSCIDCNNVAIEACSYPQNKLIPSKLCANDGDLCYSQHTPFGIVDRGCFNVNHNITTYVCSCNLCNYISISEMPYIFSKRSDWIDNVVELSRMRRFRKSVLKELSCLKCESSSAHKDMLDIANCLEGNVGSLPTEECAENEVCAIRAIRKEGYVWRGCVKTPLYNYWMTLCDSDLCNYDRLVSIYEYH